jgi:rSAM/selenodomain-associated transferase 2
MPTFSVVIPTLNEEHGIQNCIAAVQTLAPDAEIIVADGGSEDNTVKQIQETGVFVYQARRGRGTQCNAGASIASGDIFLFLHADTFLPEQAFAQLRSVFQDEQIQVAKFRIKFDRHHWFLALCAEFSRLDTIMTSFGDQCIVVRRSFFYQIGGFPDWPIYEDVHFFQKARQQTSIFILPLYVTSSARRFVEGGFYRQLFRNLGFMVHYLLGIPPQKISERYEPTNQRIRS